MIRRFSYDALAREKGGTVFQSDSTSQSALNDGKPGGEVERLYRSYSESMRRYIAKAFGAGPPDPEDAVQAAFEKYAALENRADVLNPRAFLMASARN